MLSKNVTNPTETKQMGYIIAQGNYPLQGILATKVP